VQKVYLSNLELEGAVKLYFDRLGNPAAGKEEIPAWDANGRVTAAPVYSLISSPHYNSSAMDGIAVSSIKTFKATDRNHVELQEGTDYIVVDTGDPIPKDFDCVIMVEDLIRTGDKSVAIYKAASPWQNIRPLGEDIVEKQLIVPTGHSIRAVDIGAMLAGGVNTVSVCRKPRVGIIPTGTELVEPGTPLKTGDIIDFNSRVFSAQVSDWGGIPKRYGIVKDDYESIKKTVEDALIECDMVLVNAGSSAGREDYTAGIIGELGEVVVHGAAIKPGKPVIMGIAGGKPVVGIPGYPVSAYFIMEKIVKEIIMSMQGLALEKPRTLEAILSRRVVSSLKYLEFVRMKLGYVGDKVIATPLSRGAGATMSLVRADAVLEIPQSVEGLEAGSAVQVKLLKDEEEIKNTIVCIGSHDPILDIVSDMLHLRNRKYYLSSAHVGSMGGILALKNNETHIAPIHLLDMDTGEYNVSYVEKYLPGRDISVIKCVNRVQGLMVRKNNPLEIRGLSDIVERKLGFVNRQRGSGTRLLLDYYLRKLCIDSRSIVGYEREEYTHLSVAAAIASGDADAGLGVYSAAEMMGLDFIPMANEEYDIAVPAEYLELPMIKEFIEVIKSREFKDELDRLGGYEYPDIGKVIRI
jgi:putative molybdopterin biosynthesis protein